MNLEVGKVHAKFTSLGLSDMEKNCWVEFLERLCCPNFTNVMEIKTLGFFEHF